jgi:hypothetical protein
MKGIIIAVPKKYQEKCYNNITNLREKLNVTLPTTLTNTYKYDDTVTYNAATLTDIPPTANFITLTDEFGFTPLEVELSPKSTISGTFPVEKIVWDFGDGTPLLTVSRYTTTSASPGVIYKPNYPTDPRDPRNYNVKHTYYRNIPTDPQHFYPSLTAYSANTQSYDTCSREIGPLGIKKKNNKQIIASHYYDSDNKAFFVINDDGKTSFLRKDNNFNKENIITAPTVLAPSNRVVYFNDFGVY